jgi:hypothetical protein
LNPLTKIIVLAWVGIGGVLGAHFAGVPSVNGAATALLAYNGPVSFVSVFGGFTVLYGVIAWRTGIGRRAREEATIIRDKPALANDPVALKRERRVREKEARLQRAETKAMKKENKAERKEVKVSKKENKLERKREEIGMKKERLRERERLGR